MQLIVRFLPSWGKLEACMIQIRAEWLNPLCGGKTIVVKGASWLQAAWRDPSAPHLKASDTLSQRCCLGAQGARLRQGAMQPTGAPSPPISFFSFFFRSSSLATGCQGQKVAFYFYFFINWDQNKVVLDL